MSADQKLHLIDGAVPALRSRMTRDEQVERLERLGRIVKDCPGCERFYAAPDPLSVMAPRHAPSPRCESDSRPHCTCDRCF